jgi:hypothetical protein
VRLMPPQFVTIRQEPEERRSRRRGDLRGRAAANDAVRAG